MRNERSNLEAGGRRWRSAEEGSELVERYVESGLTQRVFAQEEGIGVSTLQYWLRKISAAEGGAPRFGGTGVVSLLEVEIASNRGSRVEAKPAGPVAELEWPSGVRLRFFAGFAEQELERLVRALREEVKD